VASAVDPFWSFLRLDPDDVFAVELKKNVLEKPVLWLGGLLPLDNTPVQTSHKRQKSPDPLDVRRSLGQFCLGLDACARPHNIDFAIPSV
jgi:hypothetical protein